VALTGQQMGSKGTQVKTAIIVLMIGAILFLHYFTLPDKAYYHAVYQTLFYLPLILGGFWFGMRGALFICVAVLLTFSPYVLMHWERFSLENFDTILEGLLFVAAATVIGSLVEREKKADKARLEAERLACIGRAVSEVAHDMKTPLMAIGGFTSQVARTLESDDPIRRKLGIVIQESTRLESMVKEMLDFGGSLELRFAETDLNQIALDCMEVTTAVAKEAGVELESHFDPSMPVISLDAPRMKQVILNLVTNAIQASPAGQKVTVRARHGNHGVLLSVADCGCGIDDKQREAVFQPFFSTKKGGTGLGLPIVKKIVEAHGGDVSFRPNPQKGVTFTVRIPQAKTDQRHGPRTAQRAVLF
jgi:two-component system sensor histidine kinase HydH